MATEIPFTRTQANAGSVGPTRPLSLGTEGLKGVASLAAGIGKAADRSLAVEEKLQLQDNERIKSQALINARQDYFEFQTDMMDNHSPETWGAEWAKRVDSFMQSVDIENAPASVREELRLELDNFVSEHSLKVDRDSKIQRINQNKMSLENDLALFADQGQWQFAEARIDGAVSSGLISKEAGQMRKKQLIDRINQQRFDTNLNNDPFNEKKLNSISKVLPKEFQNRAGDMIKAAQTKKRREWMSDGSNEIIAGSINTIEELESYYGDNWGKLDAGEQEKAKEFLADWNAHEEAELAKQPERLFANMAQIERDLETLDITKEGFNDEYARILNNLHLVKKYGGNTVQPGDIADVERVFKDKMNFQEGQLQAKLQGQAEQLKAIERDGKTRRKSVMTDYINAKIKTGAFGTVAPVKKKKFTVEDMVLEGQLSVKTPYVQAGFSQEIIDELFENLKGGGWHFEKNPKEALDVVKGLMKDAWLNPKMRDDSKAEKDSMGYQMLHSLFKGGGLSSVIHEADDPEDKARFLQETFEQNRKIGLMFNEGNNFLREKDQIDDQGIKDFVDSYVAGQQARGISENFGAGRPFNMLKPVKLGKNYHVRTAEDSKVEMAKNVGRGGINILMDANASTGKDVIAPVVIVPDGSSQKVINQAMNYARGMAKMQREINGRILKPQVRTTSQNKGGRHNAIHLEGFAMTDEAMVSYLQTPAGRAAYMGLVDSTLGSISKAQIYLPHGGFSDKGWFKGGATNKNKTLSEVGLAYYLMTGQKFQTPTR